MGISKTGCSKTITKSDLEAMYYQGFKEGVEISKDRENKAYNQALEDLKNKIDDEYCDGNYGDYHEVEMIVRMIDELMKK